jgi:hypothetical protein
MRHLFVIFAIVLLLSLASEAARADCWYERSLFGWVVRCS